MYFLVEPLYDLSLVHDLQRVMVSRKAKLLEMILGCSWMSGTSYVTFLETNRTKKIWGKHGLFNWANHCRSTPAPCRAGLENRAI